MKKFITMMLVAAMALTFAACAKDNAPETTDTPDVPETQEQVADTEPVETEPVADESVAVMSYDEYVAAALESQVTVETYIQAKQGWWEKDGVGGVATFYTQNEDGAFYLYDMPCSEEDYNNVLTQGAKIRVTGTKTEWSGEVEIVDATYEVLDGSYVAEAKDLTDKLGTDELINYQNQLAIFKGMTVEKIEYKNNEPGDDIYVTLGYNGASYTFCVEAYLMGPDTAVYTAVGNLVEGDVIDVEGFVYWYEGVNTHITAISAAA